jgi:single-strand DNA-binding protein
MYNRSFLIGRLTRDPETRYTSAGVAVSRFTLAINRPTRKDGNSEVDFIRVVAWRKLAEICNEYLRKGKLVAIEGRLQFSSYEKNGQKQTLAEVVAENMQMLDRKDASAGSAQAAPAPAVAAPVEDIVPF